MNAHLRHGLSPGSLIDAEAVGGSGRDSAVPTGPRPGTGPPPDLATVARLSLGLRPLHPSANGVWWPRSADLEQEIVPLVAAFADARAGRMERVLYDRSNWLPAPCRRLVSEGEVDTRSSLAAAPGQVIVVMHRGGRVVLRVVPASMPAESAEGAVRQVFEPPPVEGAVDAGPQGGAPVLGEGMQLWFGTGGPAARPPVRA
jgi:hypothetical protein